MHAMTSKILAAAWLAATAAGCSSDIDDVESKHETSNVATTEEGGVVTAELTADATTDQRVVASGSSDVADASITIPPGALPTAGTIAVGQADDQSAALLKEATGTDVAVSQAVAPLYAAPTADPIATTGTLAITLPLPIDASSLKLTTAAGKLVFIYLVYTKDGYKSGVKTLTTANLVGTFVHTDVLGFGYFQLAYVPATVEDKEVTSKSKPGLKK
jgi:hypothetical protein